MQCSQPSMMIGAMHGLTSWLIDRLPAGSSLQTTMVVTPSTASARMLRESTLRTLAERRPESPHGMLGVHFVTVPEMARMLATRGGVPTPERRPDPIEEIAIAQRSVESAGQGGSIARYATTFGSALRHLASTVREWESAGSPHDASDEPTTEALTEFADIADRMVTTSRSFATRGRLIEAGLAGMASERFDSSDLRVLLVSIEHAKDLLDLLKAMVKREVPIEIWDASSLSDADGERAEHVEVAAAPDIEAELRDAARNCLKAAQSGVSWSEMTIALPSLTLYAKRMRRAFGAEGVPFATAGETPLSSEPRAAAFVHAARVLFGRPKRGDYAALAASHLLQTPLGPDEQLAFDRASRRFGLGGHGDAVDDFTTLLRDHAQHVGAGRDVAHAIDLWHKAAQAAARVNNTAARIDMLGSFTDALFSAPDEADARDTLCDARIRDALSAWRRALSLCPSNVEGLAFARSAEDLLAHRGMPVLGSAAPGADAVRVVTYDEARALPAALLQICGFARSMLPGSGPSEAILSGASRRALGMDDSKLSRGRERKTLDQLVRGHASHRLILSRPKRDDGGKEVPASAWLDPLLSAAEGEHQTQRCTRDLPTHPQDRALSAVRDGICPRDLALTALALDDGAPCSDSLRSIAGHEGVANRERAADLDRFEAKNLAKAGDLGPAAEGQSYGPARLSVTQLGELSQCPQRFMFSQVFGLRASTLPPEPGAGDLPRDLLGNAIHSTLEDLFARFQDQLSEAPRCADLGDAMAKAAGPIFERHLRKAGSPLRREFPAVHGVLQRRWAEALNAALADDLAALDAEDLVPQSVERAIEVDLRLRPANAPAFDLPLQGRIDRIDRRRDGTGLRVVDFKTSRSPKREVEPAKILKGDVVQLPTYAAMLEALGESVDSFCVRAVRPGLTGEEDAPFSHAPKKPWSADPTMMESFLETLSVLATLRERGAFVMTSLAAQRGVSPCTYCDYRIACRRLHPPSAERVRNSGVLEIERYDRLQGKSTRGSARFL